MHEAAFDLLAYQAGPYAPVADERDDHDLEVEGELPEGLRGMFVQNAPNPRFAAAGWHHWFDGDGMVHGVALADGRARYVNRWVRTADLDRDEAAGEARWSGILNPFDPADHRRDKHTANTDLVWHRGRLLATSWLGGEPYRLSTPDLRTIGTAEAGAGGMAAHPKVCPRTGNLCFFDYALYAGPPWLWVGEADASGRVIHRVAVETDGPYLYHDIAITEHFVIVPQYPMVFDADRLAFGKRRVRFHRDRPTRLLLVPRAGVAGPVRTFEVPACFSYHTTNAWEEGDEVVFLATRIEEPVPSRPRAEEWEVPRLFHLRLDPYLTRWRLNLRTGAVREEQLDDVRTEFQRIDDRRLGQPSRYAYHPTLRPGPTLLFDGFLKYDLHTGRSERCVWGPDRIGAEVVFAPRGAAEDDGWLVTFSSDFETTDSELVIVDAQDVAAGPVARVKLKRRMPFAFHAEWVTGEGV